MKTPESRSGLRIARFWKTKASISMPEPAIAHAINEPRMPVATPKRAGSENTPAPTMPPTTIAVSVGRLIFAVVVESVDCTSADPAISRPFEQSPPREHHPRIRRTGVCSPVPDDPARRWQDAAREDHCGSGRFGPRQSRALGVGLVRRRHLL